MALDVTLPIRIEDVGMAILSKQIEQGIDPFCQFQIALRCCHGYQPKKVNRVPATSQLVWQCLVAFNNRWQQKDGVQDRAVP